MPALSAEAAHSCAACGVATCTLHAEVRTMQPHQVGREQYVPRMFAASTDCPGIELHVQEGSVATTNAAAVERFIHLLMQVGLPRLAQEYILQINAGIAPQDIRLPTEAPFQYPAPVQAAYVATLCIDKPVDHTHEVGMESEQRLFQLLRDKALFPWIRDVIEAPPNHPSYDCTVLIEPSHPFAKMLKTDAIYVDAKSSIRGVNDYYSEKTRRQSDGARQALVREKKLWAVDAGKDMTDKEICTQFVTLLLIATNKLNKQALWNTVLDHLTDAVKTAFKEEMNVVYNYGRLVMMELVSPQLDAYFNEHVPAAQNKKKVSSAPQQEQIIFELVPAT